MVGAQATSEASQGTSRIGTFTCRATRSLTLPSRKVLGLVPAPPTHDDEVHAAVLLSP